MSAFLSWDRKTGFVDGDRAREWSRIGMEVKSPQSLLFADDIVIVGLESTRESRKTAEGRDQE